LSGSRIAEIKLWVRKNESLNSGRYSEVSVSSGLTCLLLFQFVTRAWVKDYDACGWTALFYAAAMGHDQVVLLLLEFGSDIHHRNNFGEIFYKTFNDLPVLEIWSCKRQFYKFFWFCKIEPSQEKAAYLWHDSVVMTVSSTKSFTINNLATIKLISRPFHKNMLLT
jgi:hypothetical protein